MRSDDERDWDLVEQMYNPQIVEYRTIISSLREFERNLTTPEKARAALFRARLIDEDGNATEHYKNKKP